MFEKLRTLNNGYFEKTDNVNICRGNRCSKTMSIYFQTIRDKD